MFLRSLFTTLLLGLCLVLGWRILAARDEIRRVEAEVQQVTTLTEKTAAEGARLQGEIEREAAHTADQRRLALVALSAADRARTVVGPLIERLKAEHAIRPPEIERPPPYPPTGFNFPELMSDPKYNGLAKQQQRLTADLLYGRSLRRAGLSADQVDRVLDLIAEREMVRSDYLSLTQDPRLRGEAEKRITAARAEIMDEIQRVAGPDRFQQITEEYPMTIITANADGTRSIATQPQRELKGSYEIRRASSLERRLSYSAEPLSADQLAQLTPLAHDALANYHGPLSLYQNPLFREKAGSILSPVQFAAVDELAAESAASQRRSKLPQTSAASGK